MFALLACLALVACCALGLGALGVARVGKRRRSLKSFERSCLRALEPLALPSPRRRLPQASERTAATFEETTRRLRRALISLVGGGVEQAPPDVPAKLQEQPPAAAILRFPRLHALTQAALHISGLTLLMANQHERTLPTAVTLTNPSKGDGGADDVAHSKQHIAEAQQPQHMSGYESDDVNESDVGQYESESDANQFDDSRSSDSDATDTSEDKDAQRALLDGLQFYTVLTQVGGAAVHQALHQALLNVCEAATQQRVRARHQASIAAIEQRYPDILCLSAPSYQPRTTRADLASALLAVSAAAAMQQQPCSSMQRRLSLKRPETLAFAAEDGMEPMARTPLTSPSAGSTQATSLEAASFLQAA